MEKNNSEKSVLITGANGGLGMETCKFLIQDGFRHLTLACRTDAKAQQARQDLLATTPASRGTTMCDNFRRIIRSQTVWCSMNVSTSGQGPGFACDLRRST